MKKILPFVLTLLVFTTIKAVELEKCVIYHEEDAPLSVKKAAMELQCHLEKAIGKKVAIVHFPRTPMIALGDSPAVRDTGIDPSKFEYEEYRIFTHDNNLYIVGKDLPNDKTTIYGGQSLGTWYAVFDFLEEVLGISWLIPGPKGVFYPKMKMDRRLDSINMSYRPQMKSRVMSGMDRSVPILREWLARNRHEGRWSSGSATWSGDHSWGYLYPIQNSRTQVQSLVKSREETFKEHPEFFELSPNGRRMEPTGEFSLCISNPAVADDVAARYRIFSNHTGSHFAMSSPNDGGPNCACKNCQSQIEVLSREKLGETGAHYVKDNWTKPVLAYYRRICKALPDFLVNGYIYSKYEFLPFEGAEKMPENFIAEMAPLHTGYGPIRLYEPINHTWLKWQKSWDGIFTRQIYYCVDFWMRQYAGAPMSPYPSIMRDTFQAISSRPSYVGIYSYGNQGFGHSACYNWVILKLMWNPSLDPQKLMDEFLEKAYGGASLKIKAIYGLSEKRMREFISSRKGKFGYNFSPELLQEVYATDWPEYERLYLASLQCDMDENQKWRLSMLGENLKLLRYHLVKLGLIDVKEKSPLAMTDTEFQLFNRQRAPGGDLFLYVNPPYTTSHMKRAAVPIEKVTPAVEIKNREKVDSDSFFAFHKDIIVYAPRNMDAELQLKTITVKNPYTGNPYMTDIGYFTVLDQNRKPYYDGIAEREKIVFPVQKGKFYYLFYTPLWDYAAQSRWKVISVNLPFSFGQRIDANEGLRLAWSKTPLYFNVRPGTPEFKMYFNGWELDADLVSPDGKVYPTAKNARYEVVEVKKPAIGWWKIHFRGKRGFSGLVRGSSELDGFFVINPEFALDVRIKR